MPNKSGEIQLCIDYCKLNQWTKRNAYPIPITKAVFEVMKGAVMFSKFDLKSSYKLVRVREGDDCKTAFKTKFGYFEHFVMPFGITNTPEVFQSFVNDIFSEDIGKYCKVYLDYIVVYSKKLEEHVQHVQSILKKLIKFKLVAKISKYELHKLKISFLGYVVRKDVVETDPEKINDVAE